MINSCCAAQQQIPRATIRPGWRGGEGEVYRNLGSSARSLVGFASSESIRDVGIFEAMAWRAQSLVPLLDSIER